MISDQGLQRLTVEDNLIIIEGYGAWNLNDINQSKTQECEQVKSLYSHPWGVLLLLKGDSIIIPEARERLIEIVKVDRTKGRKATALVLSDCSVPNIVTEHLSDLYSAAGDKFENFQNIDSAKQWLCENTQNT
jgi:hypothetical protein